MEKVSSFKSFKAELARLLQRLREVSEAHETRQQLSAQLNTETDELLRATEQALTRLRQQDQLEREHWRELLARQAQESERLKLENHCLWERQHTATKAS